METRLIRIFQYQVHLQCKFVLYAASDINEAVAQQNGEKIFYAIQNLLSAAANISKALWGQGGRSELERKPLRDSFGVGDDSVLRIVGMRNHFEHFDERLNAWWDQSKKHGYVDLFQGSLQSIKGVDEKDIFRAYNPRSTDVIFWGEHFQIQSIVDEINGWLPRLEQEVAKLPGVS